MADAEVAQEPQAEQAPPPEPEKPSLAARAVTAAARYAEGYVALAQREAKRDVQRVMIGVGMLVVAAVLCVLAAIFAQAFLVAVLMEFGVKPLWTFGLMLFGDLFMALTFVVIARFLLTRPLLPQSRRLIKDTADLLIGLQA